MAKSTTPKTIKLARHWTSGPSTLRPGTWVRVPPNVAEHMTSAKPPFGEEGTPPDGARVIDLVTRSNVPEPEPADTSKSGGSK